MAEPALTPEKQAEHDRKMAEIAKLDKTPFGAVIAKHLADELLSGHDLVSVHRDFCGLSIFSTNSKEFKDPKAPDQIFICYSNDGYPDEKLITFHKADDFVAWFAHQSDYSLCGISQEKDVEAIHTKELFTLNNQRISREWVLRYLEEGKKMKAEADKK